ncbi:MAG: winged helix-turn-helix domain-containing protein [Simkaniaceae bacterium]
MLKSLFGSGYTGDILIFLLINGKGYPSLIAKRLDAPLTPVQNALQKMEKQELVTSHYEGKNRLYTLNISHPLFYEIEALIKKSFSFLPSSEKKKFFAPHIKETKTGIDPSSILSEVWRKLQSTQTVLYHTHDKQGKGRVTLQKESAYALIFEEEGSWGEGFTFRNMFRWTVHPHQGLLGLEHLRFGKHHPVFLFHLVPVAKNLLESIDAHITQEETYYGYLENKSRGIKLHYRTISPHKNEALSYHYV